MSKVEKIIAKMKNSKDLNYYMSLPWKFEFEKASDGGYYVKTKNLKCHSYGETIEIAAKNIKEALELHLEGYIENNIPVPEPISEEECNGKLSVRIAKSLHCKLIQRAKDEGVSISHLVNDALVKNYAQ